jgi:hypothetical protein
MVDGRPLARVLTGLELPALETAWRRHTSTCPESPEARRRRARAAPRCRVCGGAMDPELTALETWDCHPSCQPPDLREVLAHVRQA